MNDLYGVDILAPGAAVVTLQGASRAFYGFTAFPIAEAPRGAGLYVFARSPVDPRTRRIASWTPLYLGESDDLPLATGAQNTWRSHAERQGATHVLVHFCNRGEVARQAIAEDLLAARQPPLNALERLAVA